MMIKVYNQLLNQFVDETAVATMNLVTNTNALNIELHKCTVQVVKAALDDLENL